MTKKLLAQMMSVAAFLFALNGMAQEATQTSRTFQPVHKTTTDVMKPHLGLMAGVQDPEDASSSGEYGLTVGYQPIIPLSLGAELNTTRVDADAQDAYQRTDLLITAAYNLGGDIPVIKDSYIGAGAGPVFKSNEVRGVIAPLIGFDIPLENKASDFISLGVNAKFAFYSGGEPDATTLSGVVKYWY